MAFIQPLAKRKEFIRDSNGRPTGVREVNDSPPAPPFRLETNGTSFGAAWQAGYLKGDAGQDQLRTLLAVHLPALLARCHAGGVSPELAAWAQSVAHAALVSVDTDEFVDSLPIPLSADTPMSRAVEIRAAIEDAAAAAMQRGATVALAALIGHLGALQTVPNPPAVPDAE
jgi:hypothetical protein